MQRNKGYETRKPMSMLIISLHEIFRLQKYGDKSHYTSVSKKNLNQYFCNWLIISIVIEY